MAEMKQSQPDIADPQKLELPQPCYDLLAFLEARPEGWIHEDELPEGVASPDALTVCESWRLIRRSGSSEWELGTGRCIKAYRCCVSIEPRGRAQLALRRLDDNSSKRPPGDPAGPTPPPLRPSAEGARHASVSNPAIGGKPSHRKALSLFEWAVEQAPELETDLDVFTWLKRRSDIPGELPKQFATFRRYLSGARRVAGTNKHAPRGSKRDGQGIVDAGQL
jgi:hypothetical protein